MALVRRGHSWASGKSSNDLLPADNLRMEHIEQIDIDHFSG